VSRADVERLAGEVGVETSQVWRDLQPVPLRNTFSG